MKTATDYLKHYFSLIHDGANAFTYADLEPEERRLFCFLDQLNAFYKRSMDLEIGLRRLSNYYRQLHLRAGKPGSIYKAKRVFYVSANPKSHVPIPHYCTFLDNKDPTQVSSSSKPRRVKYGYRTRFFSYDLDVLVKRFKPHEWEVNAIQLEHKAIKHLRKDAIKLSKQIELECKRELSYFASVHPHFTVIRDINALHQNYDKKAFDRRFELAQMYFDNLYPNAIQGSGEIDSPQIFF